MDIEDRIMELSDSQVFQLVKWLVSDLKVKKGIETYYTEDLEAELPLELIKLNKIDDSGELTEKFGNPQLGKALLLKVAMTNPDLIEEYYNDIESLRGVSLSSISSLFSSFLPIALILYFSIEFKVDIELISEHDKTTKSKTHITLKSRDISGTFAKFIKELLDRFNSIK